MKNKNIFRLRVLRSTALTVLAAGLSLSAPCQTLMDYFYGITAGPTSYNHGEAQQVIVNQNGEFVTAGNAYTTTGAPAATLSKYTGNPGAPGIPIWTKIFELKRFGVNICRGMSVAETAGPGITVPGYGLAAVYVDSVPNPVDVRSVLIRTNANGGMLWSAPLGNAAVSSVIYDPADTSFVVAMTAVNLNTPGVVVTSINANTGAIKFSRRYRPWSQFAPSTASRIFLDPVTGNYFVIGTAFRDGTTDILLIEVDKQGALICMRTYGDPIIQEQGIDLTLAADGSNLILCGMSDRPEEGPFQQPPTYSVLLIEVDRNNCHEVVQKGQYIRFGERLIPRAITTTPGGEYVIAGTREALASPTCQPSDYYDRDGFILGVNQYFNPVFPCALFGNTLNQGFFGKDELNDVTLIPGGGYAQVVACGFNQTLTNLNNPCAGSTNYHWLVTLDPYFTGDLNSCNENTFVNKQEYPEIYIVDFSFNASFPGGQNVNVNAISPTPDYVHNQCIKPNYTRQGAPQEPEFSARLYPNPATGNVTIQLSHESEHELMLELINTLGQRVLQRNVPAGSRSMLIDLENLAPGVYVYRLTRQSAVLSQDRLVITE